MKGFIFILIVVIFDSCIIQNNLNNREDQKMKCSKCDSLLTTNVFAYPKRFVSEIWVNQQEFITPFIPDSMRCYTLEEFNLLKENFFCLLGLSKTKIELILHPFDVVQENNIVNMKFQIGHFNDDCYQTEKGDKTGCTFFISDEHFLPYKIEKIENIDIFIGNGLDSINYDNCKRKFF